MWRELDEMPWKEYNIDSPSGVHLAFEDWENEDWGEEEEPESMTGKYKTWEPFTEDGWTIYQMNSGEYPDHDAIWIDRKNRTMIINYRGHHAPLFEQFPEVLQKADYEQTAGHFRTAPSTTEPYPAGWGWHGHPANAEEKQLLKKILKQHYQVEKLKDLYTPNEDAEENYYEAKLHVTNDNPGRGQVEWLDNDTNNLTWKGIYDILSNKMYLWSGDPSGYHHYDIIKNIIGDPHKVVEFNGHYLKPNMNAIYLDSNALASGIDKRVLVAKGLELLVPALHERWPTKETYLNSDEVE